MNKKLTFENIKNKKRLFIISVLTSTVLLTGIVYAITPLVITNPLFASIGQNQAVACDTDGVSTSFTYGASRNNGIRVTSATVTGANTACPTVSIIFIDGVNETSFTGSNTTGTVTIATNIWTNEFTDFRIVLLP